jgi:hypothetical protein
MLTTTFLSSSNFNGFSLQQLGIRNESQPDPESRQNSSQVLNTDFWEVKRQLHKTKKATGVRQFIYLIYYISCRDLVVHCTVCYVFVQVLAYVNVSTVGVTDYIENRYEDTL